MNPCHNYYPLFLTKGKGEANSKEEPPAFTYRICDNDSREFISSQILSPMDTLERHFYLFHQFYPLDTEDGVLLEWETKDMVPFSSFFSNNNNSYSWSFLFTTYSHLLTTLSLLSTAMICHHHIDGRHLCIERQTSYPLLTDFSQSLDISGETDIRACFQTYQPADMEKPLEFHLISYLVANHMDSLSSHNLDTVIHDVLEHHSVLHTFGASVISSYRADAEKRFRSYLHRPYDYLVAEALKHADTWDMVALSVSFLRIIIPLYKNDRYGKKAEYVVAWMKLLVANLMPCKPSLEESMRSFHALFPFVHGLRT